MDRHGSKLTLLHTVEFGHGNFINWYAYIALVDLESVRTDARRRLKDLAASAFLGRQCHTELCEGDPAQTITAYASDNEVDLIMMPTTGQGRLKRMLLGSVAAKVLYDAHCPVWTDTHRHGETPHSPATGPILCAIDGTERSGDLIRLASQLADAEKTGVELVHVIPALWLDPESQAGATENIQTVLEADAKARIEYLQSTCGTRFPVHIVYGDLPKAVAAQVQRASARLLIIGRGHMHAALGRLRTHVNAIIERAGCPVLSV